jgi:mannose-1-phosphate guanylyltransferase
MEKKSNIYCVIMAGGAGTRFWPMSRQDRPKQFLDVLGTGRTLLQLTYDRFRKIIPAENILIVTSAVYRDLVLEQIPSIHDNALLLEPIRRNTAPCIAYATQKILKRNSAASIVVAPSDHLILQEDVFIEQVLKGVRHCEADGSIVTLGIRPSRPDTGYGYIQFIQRDGTDDVYKVKTFTEKPNLELAKSFISSGEFLWNSGLFITSAAVMNEAFQKHLPDMHQIFEAGKEELDTQGEALFLEQAYTQCTNISIDYGIIEKASNVSVIPSEFGWSDLGTWGSLYENMHHDAFGNAVVGKKTIISNTENSIVHLPKDKVAVIHGIDNCIIVESDGILLVCRKDAEQEIRQLVNQVKVEFGEGYI